MVVRSVCAVVVSALFCGACWDLDRLESLARREDDLAFDQTADLAHPSGPTTDLAVTEIDASVADLATTTPLIDASMSDLITTPPATDLTFNADLLPVADLAKPADLVSLPPPGTAGNPFVISHLPFSHSYTTIGGQELIDSYDVNDDCRYEEETRGPEVYYRFALGYTPRISAFATEINGSAVSAFLIQGNDCLASDPDGIYDAYVPTSSNVRLVVDSWTYENFRYPGKYVLDVEEVE